MKAVSKTLIIGLGGTGQKVIRDIKKKLLRTYGEIPPLVKFLAIDNDRMYPEQNPFGYYHDGQLFEDFKYCIQNNEFYLLHNPRFDVLQNDPICNQKLNFEELHKVCSRIGDYLGTGQSRVVGRAALLNDSGSIIARLRQEINTLRAAALPINQMAQGYQLVNADITVYVVASLAGGMGSSAIMDISRMLQIAGINVQYNGAFGQDKIFGMFFMPRFFEGKPNTSNIRINAFTALSELDYTMGLADPMMYPLGSIELENDQQDYHGFPNNGKRVIYDGVYLVDALASKGHTHTLYEASSYVASFIASTIADDAAALMASYVNSNHKMQRVDGKPQNYSGMGYCEIRFCRQEFVKYLLNKKLLDVLEQFKAGESDVTASQIVQSFINDNKLNEGVMRDPQGNDTRFEQNELTDAIINMNDRRLLEIRMSAVESGREAAVVIETVKRRYLMEIARAAQEMVQSFESQKEELFQNLGDLLENHMKGKGFGTFPDLARCLKVALSEMKTGLEDELRRNEITFEEIERELSMIRASIADNSSRGFLGIIGNRRNEQEALIQLYHNKVRFELGSDANPTLAWLKVDYARKMEAVAIYEEMIAIVNSYFKEEIMETVNGPVLTVSGLYLSVDKTYTGLMVSLLKECDVYKPSKAAVNETIFVDAYFKEYFERQHDAVPLNTQGNDMFEQYLQQLFAERPLIDEEKLVEMRKALLDLLPANGLIRRVQEGSMSIDDLFLCCFGPFNNIGNPGDLKANPHLGVFEQLNFLFDMQWSYQDFRGQGLEPIKNLVVGVHDINNHIFNYVNGYGFEIDRQNFGQINYINLGDPDRIAFMLTETAVPVHKLLGVEDWAREFIQWREYTYTFSDRRLEDIDMIVPDMYKDAEVAWAYGWLVGLIAGSSKGIRIRPSYDYIIKHKMVVEKDGFCNYSAMLIHKHDIAEGHQEFIKDYELSKNIYESAMHIIDMDKRTWAENIKDWVNNGKMWDPSVRGKQRQSMTPKEMRVVQNEVKYLAMRFKLLGLSLNDAGFVESVE